MTISESRPRVAVVSPFLDKSHGTERMVVEWISRLSADFEFHVFSQQVRELDRSRIVWHRIPRLPGPHLLNYVWWFAANHFSRFWIGWRAPKWDLVFSPGVNCFDADAVSVHIVFAELLRRMAPELKLRKGQVTSWPALIHRRLYYRLLVGLERRVFKNPGTQLILTSPRSAPEISEFFSRSERFPLVLAGVDRDTFNPPRRVNARAAARAYLSANREDFVVLLIGNDWRKKGLAVLLSAIANIPDAPIKLIFVTRESASIRREAFNVHPADRRVIFMPPREDVEFYYAAADCYAGPSLEDTFALPVSEAMACGLPVIVSARAGVADFITDGLDGLILDDPTDAASLASMIRKLYEDREFRERLGANAAKTAMRFSWEENARELAAIFQEIIQRKSQGKPQTLAQEP